MNNRYAGLSKEQLDEHRMEIENRIRNLFWTISGDYSQQVDPDVDAFTRSKYIALYDAIKQGAFAKYYDSEQLGLYIMKKLYLLAEEKPLMELAQLCIDAAVYPILKNERLGIDEIRRHAFTDFLADSRNKRPDNLFGQVRNTIMNRYLGTPDPTDNETIQHVVQDILSLEGAENTDVIIAKIEEIYNWFFDPAFEQKHGDLHAVLSVTPETVAEDVRRDCLTDEQMAKILEKYLQNLRRRMTRLEIDDSSKPRFISRRPDTDLPVEEHAVDEHAVQKVHDFVDLNYGKSYLSPLEWEHRNYSLCRGIHKNCTLHYTEGILHNPVMKNNQYRFHQMQYEKNKMYYYANHRIVKKNIAVLADTLKKALIMRNDDCVIRSVSGELVASRLWKLGRTTDPKLFNKVLRSENTEFVVDIMLDSSGSQSRRQSQVAVQGYIISEALSLVGIPHRVTGYSTFWGHTILQRYRDYDEGKERNLRIFEFRAAANNRDGLAIKAIHDDLLQRSEDNKILIILSDGRPNDCGVHRPGVKPIQEYDGEEAVKDTAFEVRKARANGISVLGIFSGAPSDLSAEKLIYGKDFAYIRNISNFSKIVGTYLRRQLDED